MPEQSRYRQAFFDLWSRVYDAPPVQWAIYRPVHGAVLEELRALQARRVLDVGCGTGILTAQMGSDIGGLVCGCDLSRGMLEQATHRRAGPWVQADAASLPVRSGSVDAVVSTEAFHWFADHDVALREFHRALVPGGRMLVAFVNPSSQGPARAARTWSSMAGQSAYWPTRREMRARVEAAGFRVCTQRRVIRIFGVAFPTVLTVAERLER